MKIHKYILTAVLALCLGAGASAQDQWEFGIKGGIALNFMPGTTVDMYDQMKTNVGFQGGAYGAFYVSDMLIAQVELLYARKGVTTVNHAGQVAFDGSELKYSRNISYFQLPVMFGFHSLLNDKIKVMLGPELGVYLGDNINANYHSVYELEEYKCNPLELGLGLQATYYIIDCLGFDVKFDFGLTRVFKSNTGDRGHNAGVQFGLSYRFGQ